MGELRPQGFTFTLKYTFIPYVHSVCSYMNIFLLLCGSVVFSSHRTYQEIQMRFQIYTAPPCG